MELFNMLVEKYGLKSAIILFIIKTIWSLFSNTAQHYVKAINDNTKAINEMKAVMDTRLDKLDDDLKVAFHNIRLVNGGKIDLPSKIDQ